ncbi:MAG: DUF2637 domain-containing protein [Mycobacteriales bacterium]
MTITAVSAAVSSFAGLRSLAVATGWPVQLAPLLPFTVDAYAATATRVWLSRSTASKRTRRFARWNAIGAIGLSLAGNAIWHLLAAQVIAVSWLIVVAVGAVPPTVLGLLSHLAVLRTHVDAGLSPDPDTGRPVAGGRTDPAGRTGSGRQRTGAELLDAARAADAAYRRTHGGRPISRDALRQELRISGSRASALVRQVKAEYRNGQADSNPTDESVVNSTVDN